jgi:hypothetical protein
MGLFSNLPKFFELFKEGKQVADPKTWKERTVATNALVAVFGTSLAIAKGFGFPLELDNDTIQNLAAGVVAVVAVGNGIMHVITSKKVGMSSDSRSRS